MKIEICGSELSAIIEHYFNTVKLNTKEESYKVTNVKVRNDMSRAILEFDLIPKNIADKKGS